MIPYKILCHTSLIGHRAGDQAKRVETLGAVILERELDTGSGSRDVCRESASGRGDSRCQGPEVGDINMLVKPQRGQSGCSRVNQRDDIKT